VGEAPQLSSTYGEYNNLMDVFNKSLISQNLSYTGQSMYGSSNLIGYIAIISSINVYGYLQLQNSSNNYNPQIYDSSNYTYFGIWDGGGFAGSTNLSILVSQLNFISIVGLKNSNGYNWYYQANDISGNYQYNVFNNGNHWVIDSGYINVTLRYLIGIDAPNGAMPTYTIGSGSVTIGSGSVFQANATTFTKAPYSTVANYQPNPLEQIYTYNIYDSFGDNYITLLSNSSWTFLQDSGYASYDPTTHALTFSGVSGIGEVSASYLEPSQQLGQPSFVTLSLSAYGSSLFSGFSYSVAYVPYSSNTTYYDNGTSSDVQIPFGSTMNITVFDAWNQPVYSKTGILVDQSTMIVPISLTNLVTLVSFQFINTTAAQVGITSNGITQVENGFTSFYAANDTSYTFSASIFDASLGKNVNYTGSFTPKKPSYTIYINATAPLAEIILNANAYPGSQLGELSSSGPDRVLMTVDGTPTDLGSSYVGFVGQTINVRIFTVLNQTLATASIPLSLPFQTQTINIQRPSWNFQIKNAEQVYNTTSPLATEIINLTDTSTNTSYTTSDMVGNVLSMYLASGSYHIYLHDNATFKQNFTLSNNTYYIVFGQQLLTVTQYNQIISKIYGNTAGLQILPINAPSQIVQGQKTQLQFQVDYANGTQISGAALSSFLANSTITLNNGSASLLLTPYVLNNILYANLTGPYPGSYTVKVVGGFNDAGTPVGGHYSYPLTSITAAHDSGLHLYISGPTTVQVNTTNTYYLQFQYGNGSLLSSTASSSLLANLTATIGSDHLTPSTIGNGEYSVTYEPTAAGEFTVLVTGYFIHSGVNLTTSAFYPVSIISQTSVMIVMPVDTPSSVLVNSTVSYVFNVEFPNGTLLNDSQLSTIVSHSTLTLENSAVITPTIQVYDAKIYINFTLPDSGYYTLTWQSSITHGQKYTLIYSQMVHAFAVIQSSYGLQEAITIPGTIQASNATTGTIIFTLLNSSTPNTMTPNAAQTGYLIANTTLELLYHGKYVAIILPYYEQPGEASFTVNESVTGTGYSILSITHPTDISGRNVSFTGESRSFIVSTVNPANPPTPITSQSITAFLTSPAALAIEFIITLLGFLSLLRPKIRKKHQAEESDLNQATLVVEGNIATKILARQPLTEMEQFWWDAIPKDVRKKLMREGTAGQRSLFPHVRSRSQSGGNK
jgi:hypothetical protein